MTRVIGFGAGGHAAVVIEAFELMAMARRDASSIVGLVAREGAHDSLLGYPVLGTDDDLPNIVARTAADGFFVGLGMVRGGDPLRERVYAAALAAGLSPVSIIHPSAVVSPRAVIEPGAVVLAGAVVQVRARIGENAIVNTCAHVDHDSCVGAHSHVGPGAALSGDVRIGRMVQIGTGACVRNGVSIGDGATVGVGAAVVADCPAHAVVVGVPARERKASATA